MHFSVALPNMQDLQIGNASCVCVCVFAFFQFLDCIAIIGEAQKGVILSSVVYFVFLCNHMQIR